MATKKTVEHSKHFAKVKKYYDKDLWSKARVYKAVECKWITADEYKEITGEEYTAESAEGGRPGWKCSSFLRLTDRLGLAACS